MNKDNDFRRWMAEMGFNGRQVSEAGESIGLQLHTVSATANDRRELTKTERLAMAAVRAGLFPWHPDNAEVPRLVDSFLKVIDETKRQRRTNRKENDNELETKAG